MNDAVARDHVLDTLEQLHTAQEAHDLEAMLRTYSTQGFVSLDSMRTNFQGLIEQDAFRTRTIDMTECETFVHGDNALVKPVIYHTQKGPRCFSFHLDKEQDGIWRIVDNNRSQLPGEQVYSPELAANAGRVVGSRGMIWMRRLNVPIDDVWNAISTKDGLDQWWLTRSVEIELRPGGIFKHHWTNSIRDFKTNEFIDFIGQPDDASQSDNLMRFELKVDGEATVFSFFDGFQAHLRPLSLPWTASGWHGTVDALETALTGRSIKNDFGLGGEFYWNDLRAHHAFADQVAKLNTTDINDDEWRAAYLAPSL
jgi:uncharacterized protein YndB with AHSA1/START domain